MDLFEIIILIVRALANRSKRRQAGRSAPLQARRQQELSAQIRALQQQVLRQPPGVARARGPIGAARSMPGRTAPIAGAPEPPHPRRPNLPRARSAPIAGAPEPPPLPPRAGRATSTAQPVQPAAAAQTPRQGRLRVPPRVPLILGEVLGPPLALREPEF